MENEDIQWLTTTDQKVEDQDTKWVITTEDPPKMTTFIIRNPKASVEQQQENQSTITIETNQCVYTQINKYLKTPNLINFLYNPLQNK